VKIKTNNKGKIKMTKKQNDDTMPTTFPSKYLKVLASMPEFKEMADSASEEELKKMIVLAEGNIYSIEEAKGNDAKLNGAKEIAKDLSAPYKEALSAQTVKVKYCLFVLEGKGVELGDKQED
jgi:hypothetical protein